MGAELTIGDFPLWHLAIMTLIAHTVGAALSVYLMTQAFGDWNFMRQLHLLHTDRGAIARYGLIAEVSRFLVQVLLGAVRAPSLVIAPERYSAILNDLWMLVLASTMANLFIALIMLNNTVEHFLLRQRLDLTPTKRPDSRLKKDGRRDLTSNLD